MLTSTHITFDMKANDIYTFIHPKNELYSDMMYGLFCYWYVDRMFDGASKNLRIRKFFYIPCIYMHAMRANKMKSDTPLTYTFW